MHDIVPDVGVSENVFPPPLKVSVCEVSALALGSVRRTRKNSQSRFFGEMNAILPFDTSWILIRPLGPAILNLSVYLNILVLLIDYFLARILSQYL